MKVMVYGSTGFTGRMIVDHLRTRCSVIAAGRDEEKLAALAQEFGISVRHAQLDDHAAITALCSEVDVVLHCAGPFTQTSAPMLTACLESGCHYLDISAEGPSMLAAAAQHATAQARGVMIMPGVGVDVVPTDCLLAHVIRRLPAACRVSLGISLPKTLSRGSARNFALSAGRPVIIRRGGALQQVASGVLERSFDFGSGPKPCTAVSWGDIATGWHTTGIPDMTCYLEGTALLRYAAGIAEPMAAGLALAPARNAADWVAQAAFRGPTAQQQQEDRCEVVVEAEDIRGRMAVSRLGFPESYSFTAVLAAAIAARVVAGDHEPGFQTPGRLWGADFINDFAGVHREDLH